MEEVTATVETYQAFTDQSAVLVFKLWLSAVETWYVSLFARQPVKEKKQMERKREMKKLRKEGDK